MKRTLYLFCSEQRPELLEQWNDERNGGLTPHEVSPGSHKKVWWRCEHGHQWQAQVGSRVQGAGCPVCANRVVAAGENDLAATHPRLAAQWHPAKNEGRTAQMFTAGSRVRVWWRCEKGHEWQAMIKSRASNGSGCPFCKGKQVTPGENDLESAYPRIAAQWHPTKNGSVRPSEVTIFSNRRVWWLCEKGHDYRSTVALRTKDMTDCPYCTNRKVLTGFNDLRTVEPNIAAQWHETLNGAVTPEMVTAGSSQKVWWQCEEGHVWKAIVFSRTGARKHGCPVCAGTVRAGDRGRVQPAAGPQRDPKNRSNYDEIKRR